MMIMLSSLSYVKYAGESSIEHAKIKSLIDIKSISEYIFINCIYQKDMILLLVQKIREIKITNKLAIE